MISLWTACFLLFASLVHSDVLLVGDDLPIGQPTVHVINGQSVQIIIPTLGKRKSLRSLWSKVTLSIELEATESNKRQRPTDVLRVSKAPGDADWAVGSKMAEEGCRWANETDAVDLAALFFQTSSLKLSFSPLKSHCLSIGPATWGFHSGKETAVQFTVAVEPDFLRPLALIGGVILLFCGSLLATSVVAHMIGAGFGGSFLTVAVLCYIGYTLFLPKNKGVKLFAIAFPTGATWYSVRFCFNQEHLWWLFTTYPWILYVLGGGGLVSIIWVYLHPFSERGTKVLSLTLKACGVYCLVHCCQDSVISVAVMIGFLTLWASVNVVPFMFGGREVPSEESGDSSAHVLGDKNQAWWSSRKDPTDNDGGEWGDADLDDDTTHPQWRNQDVDDTYGSCEHIQPGDYSSVVRETTRKELEKLQKYMRANPEKWLGSVQDAGGLGRWAGLAQ
eukprot:TRINITY_DN54884_c0_g1_i1.p1 TRINITY_DN54884_c0_g1~~TRINITY_DN54884_c0_g1_i1.p1  ORF type:complete len:481 (-),score=15.15 TRINITY_DN54884_c0_g1_i1:143-1483(-)